MLSTQKLLLVDDSAQNHKLFWEMFSNLWYSVEHALNWTEAVKKCTRERFKIIIMDYEMPWMNWDEVIRKIRELWVNSKIFWFTWSPIPDVVNKFLDWWADRVYWKPSDIKKLMDFLVIKKET